ncbi:MAG: alpha-mannosidase [Clostridia bacterium]|nr:alpha-mannosidase [Clostridia bacterium]
MNINEKLKSILNFPAINGRLKGELRYALRINEARDGEYTELLDSVLDELIEKLKKDRFISDKITAETEKALEPISAVAKGYKLHVVSHAHIDMNWMWGYHETVNITLDTFRTMLRLMAEYPDFTYSQSQASTYAICEEYDPEMFEAIKEKVKEGRWEVTASTWTEADKNLSSGESLSRHHLYTKQYMKERFGLDSEALALDFEPDTFGHSAFVPEILNGGEVKYYYHCRGKELAYAYRYKAPSGAEIICYQEPFWYNGAIDDNFFEGLPMVCKKIGINSGLRVYGVGDHGGGPTRRDIERIIDMQSWPIAPTMIFSTYHAFFKELEAAKDKLPVVDTERNFIFTGCYSSQSAIKGGNRLCEDRLYQGETLSALSGVYADKKVNKENYKKAWKKVLFNQFHDIIPGSCVGDSRNHAMGMYQEALAACDAELSKGMLSLAETVDSSAFMCDGNSLTTSEGAGVGFGSPLASFDFHTVAEYGKGNIRVLHIFNPTNFDRDENAFITIWDWMGDKSRLTCETAGGEPLAFVIKGAQHYWSHDFIRLSVRVKVKAFGVTTVIIKEGEVKNIPLATPETVNINQRVEYVRPLILENDLVRAEFDNDMCLISFVDKKTGKEMIREKAAYFENYVENARIHMPNAWSEGPAVKKININEEAKVFIADKDFGTAVDSSIDYSLEYNTNKIIVTVTLAKNSSVLEYKINTDWREIGAHGQVIPTLRFKLPLAFSGEKALYDIPMGTINRPQLPHDVPARNFAFVADGKGRGVALMCNAQGAYRYFEDTLGVTLIRSTDNPDHLPEFGKHDHKVAVGIIDDNKQEIFKAAACFTQPLLSASVCAHKGTVPCEHQWLKVEGDVIVSAVKTAEDTNEMVIRFYSLSEDNEQVNIKLAKAPKSATRVNTLEKGDEALNIADTTVTLTAKPLTVNTVKIGF